MVALSSCGPKDDIGKTETEIETFHTRWNAREFATVYNESHRLFRAVASADRLIGTLQHSRNVWGEFKSGKTRSSQVTFDQMEKDVRVKYDSNYEHGAGVETFKYRITGGKPLLMEYALLGPDTDARNEAEEAKRKGQKPK
jgi:hypothetical protein